MQVVPTAWWCIPISLFVDVRTWWRLSATRASVFLRCQPTRPHRGSWLVRMIAHGCAGWMKQPESITPTQGATLSCGSRQH